VCLGLRVWVRLGLMMVHIESYSCKAIDVLIESLTGAVDRKPSRLQNLVSYFTNRRPHPNRGRETLKIASCTCCMQSIYLSDRGSEVRKAADRSFFLCMKYKTMQSGIPTWRSSRTAATTSRCIVGSATCRVGCCLTSKTICGSSSEDSKSMIVRMFLTAIREHWTTV
jgi:hypothetical protein